VAGGVTLIITPATPASCDASGAATLTVQVPATAAASPPSGTPSEMGRPSTGLVVPGAVPVRSTVPVPGFQGVTALGSYGVEGTSSAVSRSTGASASCAVEALGARAGNSSRASSRSMPAPGTAYAWAGTHVTASVVVSIMTIAVRARRRRWRPDSVTIGPAPRIRVDPHQAMYEEKKGCGKHHGAHADEARAGALSRLINICAKINKRGKRCIRPRNVGLNGAFQTPRRRWAEFRNEFASPRDPAVPCDRVRAFRPAIRADSAFVPPLSIWSPRE
jgi:hypothetical protein